MEDRYTTIGQQSGPPGDPDDHAAAALAALAHADVLVVADGGAGLPRARAVADAAVRAVVHTCSTSRTTRPSALLGEACGVAHQAVLDLGQEAAGSRRVGAHLVAAYVTGGIAAIARAGHGFAFHVHGGLADPVFPEHPGGHDGFGPTPLGLDNTHPPPIEVEVVVLAPGDRLVLATRSVADNVDALSLGRAAWSFEPQVAAIRLADLAQKAGQTSIAVQVLRRNNPSLGDAIELLHPLRQRDLTPPARAGRHRSARLRRRLFRVLLSFVALALAATMAYALLRVTRPSPDDAATRWILPWSEELAEVDARAAGDPFPASEIGPPAATPAPEPPPTANGPPDPLAPGELSRERPEFETPPPAAPPAAADPPAADDPAAEPEVPEPYAPLRTIFAMPTEDAAQALRRHIVDEYRTTGEAVFEVLRGYVLAHPDRRTVEVLVALLDRRPPPRTRAFLRTILPELLTTTP